ncbi:DUF4019 domain-containing protein [Variovorax sp. W2I14]|uniref:DUF4019 domain-containing protein n=1 Tax=Variovorax sp. W2I14 TaxID=3042290 RepID=UPI003D1D8C56
MPLCTASSEASRRPPCSTLLPRRRQRTRAPRICIRNATAILRQADADQIGELWDSGSGVLKSHIGKAAFIEATRKATLRMGAVASREWSSVTRLNYEGNNAAGLPAGRYANVAWLTRLSSGKTVSERISFARENNSWQFAGYAIAREGADAPAAEAPSSPAPTAETAEVEAAVRAWAAAWSARDMDRYLAAYAPEFGPAGGQSRKSWEEGRRARIAGKVSISVTVENLVIRTVGQTASARFRQTYLGDGLRDVSRKTLELQRSGNQWLIRKESTGG